MSVTLPGSILPTVTSAGSSLPTPVASFAWSNFPSTIDTCTSATLNWDYSGPQETLQLILVPNVSPHTNGVISRKRAGTSTTLATDIDSAASLWTWPQVNFTAGQYVVEALGTNVTVASPTFVIVNGADTSCLATSSSSSTGSTSAVTSATDSSSTSTSSSTALPAASSNHSKTGAVAGGVVAGIAVLLAAIAAYVYFGLCRRRRPHSRRHGHGAMEDAPSLGQWGGLSSRDSCMDVMGASMGGKTASPLKSRTAHGHHGSVTTLTATEEEKGGLYGKGYEYIASVPPLGYKANRRRSSASTSGMGQLSLIEPIPEPPPSAGLQGRLRSKSASQSQRALTLAKLDGGDRPYPPSAARRSIDAPPTAMPTSPPYDMGFVPPPVNRTSSGGGPGARRAVRKPVPALDSAELSPALASTVTMTSMLQPAAPAPASRSRESTAQRPPSQAAPTRSRSREDLEAAGVELPTLDHKSSFGARPVHYLIPDMPPPPHQ
ncbi:hypothetical protein LXA43DRAFT_1096324 [Ganoderma leucocontextum]|nr:hypothetical protein LXA43DRAFT_1096324 [Ganoderma leucocontextum]